MDPSSSAPLYHQAARALEEAVEDGRLPRGSRLVANQAIGARKAGAEEAKLLEIEPGDPVLTMNRVAYDANGRPVEYGYHRYPAESYWFEMMLVEL